MGFVKEKKAGKGIASPGRKKRCFSTGWSVGTTVWTEILTMVCTLQRAGGKRVQAESVNRNELEKEIARVFLRNREKASAHGL